MADIQPYSISIPDSQLDDLKLRLGLARFPDEVEGAAWDLGTPLQDVKRLAKYWKDNFDWKQAETKLNEFPQFTTSIKVDDFDPLKVHFLYQKSSVSNAIPLLFVHGWPGSFFEVTKVFKKLASGDGKTSPAFHMVAISLPNFGFSEGPRKRGFALEHYAQCCHKLMLKLGYNEYVTQGGDWGCYITRALSFLYPENCKATHLNSDFGEAPEFSEAPLLALEHAITPYSEREKAGLKRTEWFLSEGSSYREQQNKKPQTLGYGLADSPVALLAWVYEKLHDWTDAYPWTNDEICTWISIYWFSTAGPAASVRIYYETVHEWTDPKRKVTRDAIAKWIGGVKIGSSHSPQDLRVLPGTWTRKLGNIVFERFHDSGGHFFAYEKPEYMIGDVREMFGKGGGAFGCVPGKNGYI